jgi:hypothetical protein
LVAEVGVAYVGSSKSGGDETFDDGALRDEAWGRVVSAAVR